MRPSPIGRWSRPALLTVAAALLLAGAAVAQPPAPAPAPVAPPPAPPPAVKVDPAADLRLDRLANFARDELDVLKAQLDARRALLQIGEARLTRARAWQDRCQALRRERMVTEEALLAAKDDVLMLEAHVAGERAEVKLNELRIRQAQRRLDYGELPEAPADIRVAEMEHRMASMELQIDRLQHEVGKLRRELPHEDK